MAESQPRPPAPVPSSPNETSSVGSTRMTSPTNSVGTDRTVKAPEPPKAMDFAPYGRAAVLSTNLGRQPAREPPGPPFPPVILHSNKITGVFHYASYWRNKHPKIYHSFFPDSGWTITDLWDDADIHLESPSFLEEVLGFICRDNAHRANVYVYEWSKAHPEKLDMIGGDMSQIYDIHRPAAIVDKIFTDGETKQYPHMFLWHVFRNMRICMAIAVKKQQALQATAKTQGVVKADGEGMNSLKSGAPWATGKPDTVERVKQLQPASSPAVAPHTQQQPGMPSLPSNTNTAPPPRGASYGSSHPGRVYSNQANGYSVGQHATTVPNPHANGQFRSSKNNGPRSASNPYCNPTQPYGWRDNIPLPHEHQMRKTSGHMPRGQSPHFVPPMPLGPGMVPPESLPPNAYLPSPQMYAAQPRFLPTMHQNMMPPHATPLMPYPMGPGYAQPGPNGSLQSSMPFGDMTNNPQYPPPRGMDTRAAMSRRPSYINKSSRLYDPYGSERPEKAGFTHISTRANTGKTRHNSFSNNGRPRKSSNVFGSNSFERNGSVRPNGGHEDFVHTRAPCAQGSNQVTVDGRDHGCSKSHIGRDNTTVLELHVGNFPCDITEEELRNFFYQQSKVVPTQIFMRANMNADYFTHAFVHFSSTAEARQGLLANDSLLRGVPLAVSVPKRYCQHPDAPAPSINRQTSKSYGQGTNQTPSFGSHGPTNDDVAPNKGVQYSPQDARSDLRQISHQRQDCSTTRGSSEVPERKALTPKVGNNASQDEKHLYVEKAKRVADQLDVIVEQVASVEPLAAEQAVTDGPMSSKAHIDPQTDAINSIPTTSSGADGILEKPSAASSTSDTVTEESETSQARTMTAELAIPEKRSTEDATMVQTTSLNRSSSPKHPAAMVTSAPVVDSSSDVDKDISVPQTPTAEEPYATHSPPQDKTIAARTQDETASDDDQKNDLSFHSAQESQLDTLSNECRGESVPAIGVDQAPRASVTRATTNSMPRHAESEFVSKKLAAADPNAINTDRIETKDSDTAVGKPSSDAAKKTGAKQTQSLFPFAKPSKSQAKKEKQAKKKDKKKDKDKGKVENVLPRTTNNKESTIGDSQLPTTDDVPKQEIFSDSASVGETLVDSEISPEDGVDLKREAADTKADVEDAISSAGRDTKDEGKQETQKAEVQQSTGAQKAMQTPVGDGFPETCVPSHSEGANVVSLPRLESLVLEQQQPKDHDQHVKKTKQTPPMIAVPKLGDLLKFRSSATGKTTTTTTTRPTSPETQRPKDVLLARNATEDSKSVAPVLNEHASMASSPTVRAESPPPISPSPTTSTFFTPMQTPSDFNPRLAALRSLPSDTLGLPPNEPTKKKKNKKKKKAGSKVSGIVDDGPTADGKAKEPFADQLSEIDGIKSANTSGGYCMRGEQEAAREESRPDDKDSRNLFRNMQNYVREKVDTCALFQEKPWPAHKRPVAERLRPEMFHEAAYKNGESAITKELVQDSLLAEDDPSKVQKAGVRPIFHD